MREKDMEIQIRDRVAIINKEGNPIAKGTVYNINDFREPGAKYAVDVDGHDGDLLFFSDAQLKSLRD